MTYGEQWRLCTTWRDQYPRRKPKLLLQPGLDGRSWQRRGSAHDTEMGRSEADTGGPAPKSFRIWANNPRGATPGERWSWEMPGGPWRECRRWESNPHGGSPPEDFKSSGRSSQPTKGHELRSNVLAICPPVAHRHSSDDPGLTLVIEHWDSLPEPVKVGIMAMVRASLPPMGGKDNQENQGKRRKAPKGRAR